MTSSDEVSTRAPASRRDAKRACICPHGEQSLGRLYGVSMGRGTVRLSTTPGCPEHDSCRGYTAADRKARLAARWWDKPWCPIHEMRNCP